MKRKKELIVILSSLLVIVLSVSVAYFTTKILGIGKEISVESADLKVIFTSGSGTINGTNIEPGWSSGENTFTVKNESNGTYKYNIIIKDLVNTFVTEGFLQYKITSSDGGYNMVDFVDVPKSSTSADTALAENISIEKGATHTYKIVINYNNSNEVDQSADMGKMLSGKIFIEKSIPTLASKLLENNSTISTRSDFSIPFIANAINTLYKTNENGKDVYYFAGADFVEEHCEYNEILIQNAEKVNKITKTQCISTINICQLESTLIYDDKFDEDDSYCEDAYGGTLITTSNASWISSVEKPINNWVKFGGFYWRIIRTNADGSIRLLYSGTSPNTMEGYIGESSFNTNRNSPKYVGYMYGDSATTLEEARTNTNDSTIKTYIDNWYENNLTLYTNYLSNDAIYCNDRELASGSTYSPLMANDFHFKSFERLKTNKTPTYDCTNTKDVFSVNNTEAKLKYPIALMTADEVAYAGGVYQQNAPMWYSTNSTYNSITGLKWWWFLSPLRWGESVARSWDVHGSTDPGKLDADPVGVMLGVRPVLSLKFCVLWKSGDGSALSPYEIVENGGC